MKNNIIRPRISVLIAALALAVLAMPFTPRNAGATDLRADLRADRSGTPNATANSAAVLMYHRFAEPAHPSTNIRIDQFEAHIQELKSGPYTVVPLADVVAAMTGGKPLPDRAVAITIDDAYLSVYTEAWPRLRAAGFPFTVFVATSPVEANLPGFMSWDQIREMREAGAAIAAHTDGHLHMAEADPARNRREIKRSSRIMQRELGGTPKIFAYPFGETSRAIVDLIREHGYTAAFGQHSGIAYQGLSRFYLPRFALNETYGDLDRFRLVINALPLTADGMTPGDPLLSDANNPPAFGFTVNKQVRGLSRLACYHSQSGQASIERLGQSRIEVRFPAAFGVGRSRVNCTMPGPQGRWRWLGMQFYVKRRG